MGLLPNGDMGPPGRPDGPATAARLADPSGFNGLLGLPWALSMVPVGALLEPHPMVGMYTRRGNTKDEDLGMNPGAGEILS